VQVVIIGAKKKLRIGRSQMKNIRTWHHSEFRASDPTQHSTGIHICGVCSLHAYLQVHHNEVATATYTDELQLRCQASDFSNFRIMRNSWEYCGCKQLVVCPNKVTSKMFSGCSHYKLHTVSLFRRLTRMSRKKPRNTSTSGSQVSAVSGLATTRYLSHSFISRGIQTLVRGMLG